MCVELYRGGFGRRGLNACTGGVAARQQRWWRDGVFAGAASLRQKAAMCLSEDFTTKRLR